MLRASVIVPTYKRLQFLLDAVKSIADQNVEGQFEIVVVDNSPSRELSDQVCSLSRAVGGKPDIMYVEEPRAGLHVARHTGAHFANAELLVYCDDDILAKAGWLASILSPFSNPSVACVGGKVLAHWEAPPPSWIRLVPESYYSLLDYGDVQRRMNQDECFYGCNFAIRKKVLLELGGFNPDGFRDPKLIWHRGDGEVGLMRKLNARDYRVIYAPGAVVEHRIPSERLRVDYAFRRAFNSGIQASYVFYRYQRPTPLGLIYRILRLAAGYLLYHFRIAMGSSQEEYFLRYRLRKEAYRANLLHTIRLLVQRDLRHFCQREDYLEA